MAIQHARLPSLRGGVLHLRATVDAVAGLSLDVGVPRLELGEGRCLSSLWLLRVDRLGFLKVLLLLGLSGRAVGWRVFARIRNAVDVLYLERARKALLLDLTSMCLIVQVLRAARCFTTRGFLLGLRLVVGVIIWRFLCDPVHVGSWGGGLVVCQRSRGQEALRRRELSWTTLPLWHLPHLLLLVRLLNGETAGRVELLLLPARSGLQAGDADLPILSVAFPSFDDDKIAFSVVGGDGLGGKSLVVLARRPFAVEAPELPDAVPVPVWGPLLLSAHGGSVDKAVRAVLEL